MNYVIPVFILGTLLFAFVKKISIFNSISEGVKESMLLIFRLVPNLVAVFVAIELLRKSGVSAWLGDLLSPVFMYLGIPKEVVELIILRPLSGSGSLALLENIFATYGADGYVGIASSIIMGSTETIVYVCSVYFAKERDKKTGLAIPIALFSSLIGAVIACAFARLIA